MNGDSLLSRRAIANIRRIIDDHLPSPHRNGEAVEIVDVVVDPERADEARILATPTLVLETPTVERRVSGDLSDVERVLLILELGNAAPK